MDPHGQRSINHRPCTLPALSFLSSVLPIYILTLEKFSLLLLLFSSKKIIEEGVVKSRKDLGRMVVNISTEGLWDFKSCKQSSLFNPRLDKMQSSVCCLEMYCLCYSKWIDPKMLVVLEKRSRQGHFLLVFILALDLSVCLLITQSNLSLVWLLPLCHWPGDAS